MIEPARIREIHHICQEWNLRKQPESPTPRFLRIIPAWIAILLASAGIVILGLAHDGLSSNRWKLGFSLAALLLLFIVLIYLLCLGLFGARSIWNDLRESFNPFPTIENQELEGHLTFLRRLAMFTDDELLFVARSLETKSKRSEHYRTSILGIGSLVAASIAFLATHHTEGLFELPKYAWLGKLLPIVGNTLKFLAFSIVVGGGLGVVFVWLEAFSSTSRALILRRVVEDRVMLTNSGPYQAS